VANGVARGEPELVVAEDDEGIVGAVQLVLAQPENTDGCARRVRRPGLTRA
jgi:hypothetical protein